MERREFLAAAGVGTLGALAGCAGAIGAVAPPTVPRDRLERGGWELQSESQRTVFEEQYGPVTVTAKAHSLTYSDVALRRTIAERTLGRVDGRIALFAATRIQFDPDLADVPLVRDAVLDRTESAARDRFVERMRAAGLQSVERTDTGTFQVETGETARATTYAAEFPVSDIAFQVAEGASITVPVSPLAVEGSLAVWAHGGSVLVAGGAYPAENVSTTVTETLTSAISVTVDVDLGLRPDEYRSEVHSLMRSVR
ncbi:MAG: hypothetical protein ABEJ76_03845 [Halanaeroarchaeum sp.]